MTRQQQHKERLVLLADIQRQELIAETLSLKASVTEGGTWLSLAWRFGIKRVLGGSWLASPLLRGVTSMLWRGSRQHPWFTALISLGFARMGGVRRWVLRAAGLAMASALIWVIAKRFLASSDKSR